LIGGGGTWYLKRSVFLRCHSRKKNGQLQRYWSVVESRRVAGGDPVPRPVLRYLGEINDSQEAA
jgi:hypothetical protein